QGRLVRQAIARIVPDDMDEQQATLFQKDLERDVTDYILTNRVRNLRVEQLPDILERRLALYGITVDAAAERMQDTGDLPLPVGARTARRQPAAPVRGAPRPPARTGEQLAARVEARRRAGAVPGGGAGIPAAGIALPRKQGIKARIA